MHKDNKNGEVKMVETIYKCDACENTVNSNKELSKVTIPCKSCDDEGRKWYRGYKEVDLCPSCKEKYENVVFEHFGLFKNVLGTISFEKAGDKDAAI